MFTSNKSMERYYFIVNNVIEYYKIIVQFNSFNLFNNFKTKRKTVG